MCIVSIIEPEQPIMKNGEEGGAEGEKSPFKSLLSADKARSTASWIMSTW